jgi:hypothetical protein
MSECEELNVSKSRPLCPRLCCKTLLRRKRANFLRAAEAFNVSGCSQRPARCSLTAEAEAAVAEEAEAVAVAVAPEAEVAAPEAEQAREQVAELAAVSEAVPV